MKTSKPIADYALIGDTHSTALVASDGRIDWLCWPRHDSPAVLTRLLDEEKGGSIVVELDGLAPSSRAYRSDSAVLETRFAGPETDVILTDMMPVHPPSTEQDTGPDGNPASRIVRLLTSARGRASGRILLKATPDYGRAEARLVQNASCYTVHAENIAIQVTGSHPIMVEDDTLVMRFDVSESRQAWFCVSLVEQDAPPPLGIADVRAHLAETERYWHKWSGGIHYNGAYREAVVRSAVTLKLLTYSPTGAILAAATTSLPEAVPGNRNYDYRYSWVRDASFTVTAFCNMGLRREAAEYLRFLLDASANDDELGLLYGIDGPISPESELAHLPGWNDIGPVRIGNAAEEQDQHDIYGEFMVALHAWLDALGYDVPAWIAPRLPGLIADLANHALRCRNVPDKGIWELRSSSQHLQHSKALLWVALDRAVKLADHVNGLNDHDVTVWRQAAAEIREEYEREAWDEERGAYMQGYGSDVLDAAVLRTVLFGALDPMAPRTRSTLRAVERELSEGDLTYRYRMDDGLEGDEATFTACAFWRVGVMALGGRTAAAKAMFERLLDCSNDVGLFAEEIDVATGEQRGNVPQGFTHMCVINHAVRLEEAIARFGLVDDAFGEDGRRTIGATPPTGLE